VEKGSTAFDAGVVSIALGYRDEIMHDQGLSVQVYGDVDGKDTEILRFDCFDQRPHYHYGPENYNIRLEMDKTTAGNPLGWTMSQIGNKLPAMIQRAGYEDLAAKLEASPITKKTLDEVVTKARELSRSGRRTVTHNVGDHMFEAGNIRFGLEFREIPEANERGMAIHVRSEVAGEEIELLAFDCFEGAPHYHYGPRNQDIRIYWDTTTSGETLRWTLDQFKDRKLKAMIERAGYPAIAAELDEGLVQSILPAMEKKAFAVVAENAKK